MLLSFPLHYGIEKVKNKSTLAKGSKTSSPSYLSCDNSAIRSSFYSQCMNLLSCREMVKKADLYSYQLHSLTHTYPICSPGRRPFLPGPLSPPPILLPIALQWSEQIERAFL